MNISHTNTSIVTSNLSACVPAIPEVQGLKKQVNVVAQKAFSEMPSGVVGVITTYLLPDIETDYGVATAAGTDGEAITVAQPTDLAAKRFNEFSPSKILKLNELTELERIEEIAKVFGNPDEALKIYAFQLSIPAKKLGSLKGEELLQRMKFLVVKPLFTAFGALECFNLEYRGIPTEDLNGKRISDIPYRNLTVRLPESDPKLDKWLQDITKAPLEIQVKAMTSKGALAGAHTHDKQLRQNPWKSNDPLKPNDPLISRFWESLIDLKLIRIANCDLSRMPYAMSLFLQKLSEETKNSIALPRHLYTTYHKELDVSNAKLVDIYFLKVCKFQRVNLANNEIHDLSPLKPINDYQLHHSTKLTDINVAYNPISSLQPIIDLHAHLTDITLSEDQVERLPEDIAALKQAIAGRNVTLNILPKKKTDSSI